MSSYNETYHTWNKVAALYQQKFMHLTLYNQTYDAICKALPQSGAAILEIGCGPGNITQYLLAQRPDFNIWGIDVAENMIALAKENNPAALFMVMNAQNILQLQQTFDAIVAGFCIPYLSPQHTGELIENCYTLLNNDGFLYLSFVEGNPANSGYKTAGTGDRTYFYYHTLVYIQNLLTQTGYNQLQVYKVNYPVNETTTEEHTIITARK